MSQVIITINYREYPISCENGEEVHIMKLGNLLDEKARSLTKALGPVNENMLLAMVGLILADELSELKKSLNTQSATATVPTPTPTQVQTQSSGISEENLKELDKELATHLNSLNDIIKSVALKLKSV